MREGINTRHTGRILAQPHKGAETLKIPSRCGREQDLVLYPHLFLPTAAL
jgi:hypothetical protein